MGGQCGMDCSANGPRRSIWLPAVLEARAQAALNFEGRAALSTGNRGQRSSFTPCPSGWTHLGFYLLRYIHCDWYEPSIG